MKPNVLPLFVLAALSAGVLRAQDASPAPSGLPFTVSVFSHAVSLPTFRGFFRNPNFGVRVGTELYYRNRPGAQLVQAFNAGFYRHRALQTGLFLSTEFGYRKFIGGFYAEGFVGVGALGLAPHLRRYKPTGNGEFKPASRFMLRAMPTLGAGLGYRFRSQSSVPLSVFARYEMFGETPFGNRGVPLLPHAALHVGTRVLLNSKTTPRP